MEVQVPRMDQKDKTLGESLALVGGVGGPGRIRSLIGYGHFMTDSTTVVPLQPSCVCVIPTSLATDQDSDLHTGWAIATKT